MLFFSISKITNIEIYLGSFPNFLARLKKSLTSFHFFSEFRSQCGLGELQIERSAQLHHLLHKFFHQIF